MIRNPLPYLLLLACAGAAPAAAQVPFSAGLIPDSLRQGAHSVVREMREALTISSASKAVLTVHKVVTVLDAQGAEALYFQEHSTKFEHLEDAHINVYDAGGVLTQHFKQRDMETEAFGEDLVVDGSYTVFKVSVPSYPATVETDYTIDYTAIIGFPDFSLPRVGLSYQEADFVLTTPSSLGIRYKSHLLTCNPVKVTDPRGDQVYTWKVTGFRARDDESNFVGNRVPAVWLAPDQFEMDDHLGDMTTWKSFGQWDYNLNKENFVLPDASKAFYQQLVAGANTDLDKARIIYQYLQKNFRYVAIELGISGFRSFPAAFTEQKKYGDCKGLSCYMKACLDAVGIKSYTALVNAGYGEAPVDPTFPDNNFNHVILCIPGSGDTTWLECTGKYTDFGVLSEFTENRYALLITETGGVLVRTPRSTSDENTSSMSGKVFLSSDGGGRADINMTARGQDKLADVGELYEADGDAQKKFLVSEYYQFKQPDTCRVTLGDIRQPVLGASLYMTFEQVPDFSAGSKMFLPTRLYRLWDETLPDPADRREDYYFDFPMRRSDTTAFVLPGGYTVDDLPKGATLSCPYVDYTSRYWYDSSAHTVYSSAILTIAVRKVPVAEYGMVQQVFERIRKDADEKIVIAGP